MKDQIFENYSSKINELNEMKQTAAISESKIQLDESFAEVVESVGTSEVVFLEGNASDSILVLAPNVNGAVYETVLASAYDLLTVQEAFETKEDEDSEEDKKEDEDEKEVKEAVDADSKDYEGDAEDEGSADEEDRHPQMKNESADADADDKDEDKEEVAAEDKDKVQEALIDALASTQFVLRSSMDESGWVIDSTSPYFEVIKEALSEQLSAICEAFGETELLNNYVEVMENYHSLGMSISEAKKGTPFYKKAWTAIKGEVKKDVKNVKAAPKKAWQIVKKTPAAIVKTVKANPVKASLAATAAAAYGAKKLHDKSKNESAVVEAAKPSMVKKFFTSIPKDWKKGGLKNKAKAVGKAAGVAAGAAGIGYGAKKLVDKSKKD